MSTTEEPPATVFVPVPTHVFTAKAILEKVIGPIPLIEGGQRIVEPISGGSISGPGFNGTIEGGLAAPIINKDTTNGTMYQWAIAYLYGHASDGSPFYVEKHGLGVGASQTARIVLNVSGQYAGLQSMYLIAQPKVNEARNMVVAECYSVPLPPA